MTLGCKENNSYFGCKTLKWRPLYQLIHSGRLAFPVQWKTPKVSFSIRAAVMQRFLHRKSYERECISFYMGTSDVFKVLQIWTKNHRSCHGEGGVYSQKKLGSVARPVSQNPYPIYTKICNFPNHIYDLTKNLMPYLWPDSQIITLFTDLPCNYFPSSDQC